MGLMGKIRSNSNLLQFRRNIYLVEKSCITVDNKESRAFLHTRDLTHLDKLKRILQLNNL